MATATHHPDAGYKHASGFGMWALMSTTTPGELADWQTLTSLNGTELSYLGTDNTNGVAVEQTWGWCAAGFVARFTVSEGTPSQIAFTLKGYDPGGCGVGFYAWNFTTGAFVSLASHTGGAPGNWTLSHTISSNVSDYLDSGHFWLLAVDTGYCGTSNSFGFIRAVGDSGTYYPDAGYKATGVAWGVTLGQTGTLAQWQAMTALTATEKGNLGGDDYTTGVTVQPSSGTSASGILARMTVADGTVSQLDFTVKGLRRQVEPTSSGRGTSAPNPSTWSHRIAGGMPGSFTLSGSITSDAGDYLDGSGYLWVVVEDCTYDAQSHSIYFIEAVDTYTEAAAPVDVAPGSQAQSAGTAGGSQTHVAGAASGSQAQAAGALSQSARRTWPGPSAPSPQSQVAEAVSGSVASAVGSPAAGYQGQSCGPVSVRQTHVAGAAAAGQGQSAGQADGLAWPAFGSPAPGSQGQSHGVPTGSQTHVASPVSAGQGQSHEARPSARPTSPGRRQPARGRPPASRRAPSLPSWPLPRHRPRRRRPPARSPSARPTSPALSSPRRRRRMPARPAAPTRSACSSR